MRPLPIVAAAFAALSGTLAFGHAGLENQIGCRGLVTIKRSCESRMDAMAMQLIPLGCVSPKV